MKINKYIYYKTIQELYGKKWESVDFHECNSAGTMTTDNRALFKENLKAYRENSSRPIQAVITKEPNPKYMEILKEYKGKDDSSLIMYKNAKGYFCTETKSNWDREYIGGHTAFDDERAFDYIDDIARHSPMLYNTVVKGGSDEATNQADNIKPVPTTRRDCGGCYYAIGNRFLKCPTACNMSTVQYEAVIYKLVKGGTDGTD